MYKQLKGIYARATLPAKSVFLGLVCGLLTWTVLNAFESRHLKELLLERAREDLREEAASNRMIFHHYLKQHVQLTKLIASYQPLVTWLEQQQDKKRTSGLSRYEEERPDWFPPLTTWRGLIDPRYFLFHDAEGHLRAVYRLSEDDLPLDSALQDILSSGRSDGQIYLVTLAGHPYLITSSVINDTQGRKLSYLTLLSRFDDEFVSKLNYATDAPNVILGLFEGAEGRLLASNQPERLVSGVRLEELQRDYLATGKPFFDYGSSELRLQLATLIPLDKMAALNAHVLDAARNQHLVAAVAFTLAFTWLIFSWSRRIERVLRQIHGFSQQVAGVSREFKVRGDALWQLERDFVRLRDEILAARESLDQQQLVTQRLMQLELLETVADHLGIGVLLLGAEGDVELQTQQVGRFETTLGNRWYRPFIQRSAQERELNLKDDLENQYTFKVSRLSLFRQDDVVLIENVTEQMRLQRRLREQEVQFRRITGSARDAIVSIDHSGDITVWNRAAEAMFQFSASEIEGTSVTGIMPASYREAHRSAMQRIGKAEAAQFAGNTLELEGLRKDGTTFPIELSLSTWELEENYYFTGILRDITERKQAEEALQESQSRFSLFMDRLPAAIFIKAAYGGVLYVNEYLKTHFGAGDSQGTSTAGDFPVEIVEQLSRDDHMVLAEGWYEIVQQLTDREGRKRTFRIHNFAIPGPAAEESLVGSIAWDITDTVAASEALRGSERRYREIFETAEEGIWLIDAEANTAEVNHRMAEMLGYTVDEMGGRHLFEFMDEDVRKEAEANLDRRRKGIAEKHDFRFRTKGGADLWTIVSTAPMYDAQGGYAGALGMIADITERKRAEAAVKQERDFAESLIETAPVIVLVLDPQGNIVRFNSFMESLSGYSLAEVKGQSWFDIFFAAPDVSRVAAVFAETKGGTQTGGKLNPILTRDGRERLIVWYNTQLRDPGGELTAVLAIGHDVTEQRAKEAQLRQAQKMEMVGQLTGGIAHDFNNLLTVILGNLNLLAKSIGPDCDPEVFDLMDDSLSAAQDGADLTKRLLIFSRKKPLQRKRINLPEFLEHFEQFLRRTLGADIAVQVDVEGHLGCLICDPSQLQSALLNLALNARDSMARGGRLSVRAKEMEVGDLGPFLKPGNYVELAVIDTGEGMTPEQLDRAIEPFYTTKASKQGTGLGLSMVYGFSEQAGGRFQLASEPGVGTRATIILPVDGLGGRETTETLEGVPQAFAGKGTVLVVEDEARVRKLAARYLTELGYHVLMAENGDTAIEALRSESAIELVFSDVAMPGGISGDDLYRWVKEQRPEVRVLLTTGLQPAEIDELTNEGELSPPIALPKPYNKEQLAAAIRDVAGF